MPRFVIQKHTQNQRDHWDLMLEIEQKLATWQIPIAPSKWSRAIVICQKIFDHRLIYLDYQGLISNNRGEVEIAAKGEYKLLKMDENICRITLESDTVSGNIELTKLNNNSWQLNFVTKKP